VTLRYARGNSVLRTEGRKREVVSRDCHWITRTMLRSMTVRGGLQKGVNERVPDHPRKTNAGRIVATKRAENAM